MKTSKADKWFSLYIRLRDTDEDGVCRCITCGRAGHPKSMDCGHYIKRQHQAVRFDEINCNAQCKRCNAFEQGQDAIYRQRLIEKHGEDAVFILETAAKMAFKRSQINLDYLADEYKRKAKEEAEKKGIKLW